jgi:hypothetical protein
MGSDIHSIWGEVTAGETAVAGFSGQTMAEVKPKAFLFVDKSKG